MAVFGDANKVKQMLEMSRVETQFLERCCHDLGEASTAAGVQERLQGSPWLLFRRVGGPPTRSTFLLLCVAVALLLVRGFSLHP